MSIICTCQEGLSHSKPEFVFMLLDYYDGPVSGTITCPHCNVHFGFDMLDWTDNHRYRMFALYAMEVADYEAFKSLIEAKITGQTDIGTSNYELLKKIIHPKIKPDELVIWDNVEDVLIITIPVPTKEDDNIWISWFDNPSKTSWFTSLNIALPFTD